MKMEQTECSETSEYKIQTQGNYPEENIQHTEHGESLKSRKQIWFLRCILNRFAFLQNVPGVSEMADSEGKDKEMSECVKTNCQRKWNIFAWQHYGNIEKAWKKTGKSIWCCKPVFQLEASAEYVAYHVKRVSVTVWVVKSPACYMLCLTFGQTLHDLNRNAYASTIIMPVPVAALSKA